MTPSHSSAATTSSAPVPRGTTPPPTSSPARGCESSSPTTHTSTTAYTLCAVERLREALRRRDVFVPGSRRWADPRRQLLSAAEWEAARDDVCRSLRRSPDARVELGALADKLDAAYRRTATGLPDNEAVTIVEKDGKARLKLSPLDRLDEPASLVELRRAVGALLPKVDLPEVVLEVARWTGFAEEFTHVSEAGSRAEDLVTSICAVLVAEACNVGLEPMVRQDVPALRRGRLGWVAQNYLRAETLARANARLVAYHAELPLARMWGGGEVASVDGLRFVVPVPSVHAGRNPKYYGFAGRGVTYLNYVSDQFSGFHAIVVPGTLRDSMFILDGLLEQQTVLDPTEVMADTASYPTPPRTRTGFSACSSCSATSSARDWPTSARRGSGGSTLAPTTGRSTPWPATASTPSSSPPTGRTCSGWPARSPPARSSPPSSWARCGAPRARPPWPARSPSSAGSPRRSTCSSSSTAPPTVGTSSSSSTATRPVTAWPGGSSTGTAASSARPTGRAEEDQLGALGLVLNILVLWTTRYLEAALDQLDRTGHSVDTKDVKRLSPLKFRNVNLHGRYSFVLSEEVARGALRPLRDDREPDEDDVDA